MLAYRATALDQTFPGYPILISDAKEVAVTIINKAEKAIAKVEGVSEKTLKMILMKKNVVLGKKPTGDPSTGDRDEVARRSGLIGLTTY